MEDAITKTSTQVGDRNTAKQIAQHLYSRSSLPLPDGCEWLAIGGHRAVYVDRRNSIVAHKGQLWLIDAGGL